MQSTLIKLYKRHKASKNIITYRHTISILSQPLLLHCHNLTASSTLHSVLFSSPRSPSYSLHSGAPPTPFTQEPLPLPSLSSSSHSLHPGAPPTPFTQQPLPLPSLSSPSHSLHPGAPPTPFTQQPLPLPSPRSPTHSLHSAAPPTPFTQEPLPLANLW